MKKNYFVFLIIILVILIFSACMMEDWMFPGFNTPSKKASNVEVTYSPLNYGYVGQKFEIEARTNGGLNAAYIRLITSDGQVMEKTNTSYAKFYVSTTTEEFGFVVEIPGKTGDNAAFKSPIMTADDRTPPQVSVSYQRVNDYSNDFTISLTASDPQSSITEKWIVVDDEILLMNDVRTDTTNIRKNLSIGEHTLIGFARNQKGLKGNSVPINFRVDPPSGDNTPPVFTNATLYMPDGRDFAYKGEEIRVIGSVEDDISYIKRVELQSPGNSPWIIEDSKMQPDVDFDYVFKAQNSGNVIITAKNGNNLVSQKIIPETSNIRVIEHQAPKIVRVFEISGQEPLEGKEQVYRAEFQKTEGTTIEKLEIKLDGAKFITDTAPSNPYEFKYTVEKGEHEFVLNIWDDKGAKGTYRFTVIGQLDDKEGPLVYMSLSPSIPYMNETTRIYLACRDESGIDMSSVNLRIKGADQPIIPVKEDSYYFDWTPTATGVYAIELFVKDKLGNQTHFEKAEEVFVAEDLKGPRIQTFGIDQEDLYYGDPISFTAVILPPLENAQAIEAWVEISDPLNSSQMRGVQLPLTRVGEEGNIWKTESHFLNNNGLFEAYVYARSGNYTNRRSIMFEIKNPTLEIKSFESVPVDPAVGEKIQLRVDVSILPKSDDVFIEKSGVKFDFDTNIFFSQQGVYEVDNDPLKRFAIDLTTVKAQAKPYTFNVEVEDSRGQKDSQQITIDFREPQLDFDMIPYPLRDEYPVNQIITLKADYTVPPDMQITPQYMKYDVLDVFGDSFIGGAVQISAQPFNSEPIEFNREGEYTVEATMIFDNGTALKSGPLKLKIIKPDIRLFINSTPTENHFVNDHIKFSFPYSMTPSASIAADYVLMNIIDETGQSLTNGERKLTREPFETENIKFTKAGKYDVKASIFFKNGYSAVATDKEVVIRQPQTSVSIEAQPGGTHYLNDEIVFTFPYSVPSGVNLVGELLIYDVKRLDGSSLIGGSVQLSQRPFTTNPIRFTETGQFTVDATLVFDNEDTINAPTFNLEIKQPQTEVNIVAEPSGVHYVNDMISFNFPYSVTPGVNLNADYLIYDIKNPDGSSYIGGQNQLLEKPFSTIPIKFANAQMYTVDATLVFDNEEKISAPTFNLEIKQPQTEVSIVASPTGIHYANDEIIFRFPYSVTPGVNLNADYLLMDIKKADGTSFIGGEKQLDDIPFVSEPIRFPQTGQYTVDATLVFDNDFKKKASTFNLTIQTPGYSFEINASPTGDHYVNDAIQFRFPYTVSNNANIKADYVTFDIRRPTGGSMISGPIQLNTEPFVSEIYTFVDSGTYQLAATLTFENGDQIVASDRELVIQDIDFTFNIDASPTSSPYYINQPVSFSFPYAITQETDIEPKYVNLSIRNASDVVVNSQQLNDPPFETSAFRFMISGEHTLMATMAFENIENVRTRTKTINIEDTRITWHLDSNRFAVGEEVTFIAWVNNNNQYDTLPQTFNVRIMNSSDVEIGNISMIKDDSYDNDELETKYRSQTDYTFLEEGQYTLNANIMTILGAVATPNFERVEVSENALGGSLVPEPLTSYIGQEQKLVLRLDQIATGYDLQNIQMWATPTQTGNGVMKEIANIEIGLPLTPVCTGVFTNDDAGEYDGIAKLTFQNGNNWTVQFNTSKSFTVLDAPQISGFVRVRPTVPKIGINTSATVSYTVEDYVNPVTLNFYYDGIPERTINIDAYPTVFSTSGSFDIPINSKGDHTIKMDVIQRGISGISYSTQTTFTVDSVEPTNKKFYLEPIHAGDNSGNREFLEGVGKNFVFELTKPYENMEIDHVELVALLFDGSSTSTLQLNNSWIDLGQNIATFKWTATPTTAPATITVTGDIYINEEGILTHYSAIDTEIFSVVEAPISVTNVVLNDFYLGFIPGMTVTIDTKLPKSMIRMTGQLLKDGSGETVTGYYNPVTGKFEGDFTRAVNVGNADYDILIEFTETPLSYTPDGTRITVKSGIPRVQFEEGNNVTTNAFKVFEVPQVTVRLADSVPSGLENYSVTVKVTDPGNDTTFSQVFENCNRSDTLITSYDLSKYFSEAANTKEATVQVLANYGPTVIGSTTFTKSVGRDPVQLSWQGFDTGRSFAYEGQQVRPRIRVNTGNVNNRQVKFEIAGYGNDEGRIVEALSDSGETVFESVNIFQFKGVESGINATAVLYDTSVDPMEEIQSVSWTFDVLQAVCSLESFTISDGKKFADKLTLFTARINSTFGPDDITWNGSPTAFEEITKDVTISGTKEYEYNLTLGATFSSSGEKLIEFYVKPKESAVSSPAIYEDKKDISFEVFKAPVVGKDSNGDILQGPSEIGLGDVLELTLRVSGVASEVVNDISFGISFFNNFSGMSTNKQVTSSGSDYEVTYRASTTAVSTGTAGYASGEIQIIGFGSFIQGRKDILVLE